MVYFFFYFLGLPIKEVQEVILEIDNLPYFFHYLFVVTKLTNNGTKTKHYLEKL